MDPSGDNSPLWGATQLNYQNYNGHQTSPQPQSTQWIEGDPQQHQQVLQNPGYNPYPIQANSNYAEVRNNTSPEIVEADSTIAENGATIYQHAAGSYHQLTAPVQGELFPVPHGGYQPPFVSQLPFSNSINVLLPENGPYPPAEANVPGKDSSPDRGYSSPGLEYYQLAPQGYSAESTYQNVDSPPETGLIKYEELEVKQEDLEVYRSDQFVVYPQPTVDNNSGQKLEDNKAIIHENIIIKPATNPQMPLSQYQQPQFQVIELPNSMNLHIQAHLPYDHASQVNRQIQQPIFQQQQQQYQIHRGSLQKAQIKQRKPRGPTSSTASARFRLIEANRPSTEYKKPEEESEVNLARRSARPSVVEQSDYKCTICGTFFVRQCGLSQHHKWIHAERNFPCEKCGKKFVCMEDLAKHLKRHDMKDKPYKCTICPKQFCHKNDLRRHTYRHETTTPFQCDVCPKCFIRKDHLTAHLKSHERREKKTRDKTDKDEKEENFVVSTMSASTHDHSVPKCKSISRFETIVRDL